MATPLARSSVWKPAYSKDWDARATSLPSVGPAASSSSRYTHASTDVFAEEVCVATERTTWSSPAVKTFAILTSSSDVSLSYAKVGR